jgi:hypothetical protein
VNFRYFLLATYRVVNQPLTMLLSPAIGLR